MPAVRAAAGEAGVSVVNEEALFAEFKRWYETDESGATDRYTIAWEAWKVAYSAGLRSSPGVLTEKSQDDVHAERLAKHLLRKWKADEAAGAEFSVFDRLRWPDRKTAIAHIEGALAEWEAQHDDRSTA